LSKVNSNRYPDDAVVVPNDALRVAELPTEVELMKELAVVGGFESGGLLPHTVVPFSLNV
jgi:hypothetical protein